MNDVKTNILLVDDNHDNLRVLTSVLTRHRYEVRPIDSGEKALTAIRAKQPDLILLDIRMPGMSGYEVCEHLKADERTCDIPIIFISALHEVEEKVKAFSLRAVDYITKPFQEEDVLARVETHMNLRKFQTLLEDKNASLYQEIIDRKQAETALCYRIEFEGIIMNISSKFIRLSPAEVDEEITETLKTIGEFAGVDRAYVFQFHEDKKKMDNTHEWSAHGIGPQIRNRKGIAIDDELPWFSKKIMARETFYIPSVSALPQEADLEQKHFKAQDIQSLIVVPMVSGNILTGFLGFDSVRTEQKWPQDNIALLRIIGEVISNALERKRAEEEREKLIHDLQKALDEVTVLSGLLPICSFCKNVRDDKGYWQEIETYIENHSEAEFTHSLCNNCLKKHYPDIYEDLKKKGKIK